MTTIVINLEEIEAHNLAFRIRVALRLRQLREQHGLTLEDLVSILSCAPTQASTDRVVTLRQLEDVERAYHVVENPSFFYTMLYELFDHDPAFNPADIPPRVWKGRGDPKLKERAWNDHVLMAWNELYERQLVEMKTLLEVAKSEGKTIVLREFIPPDGALPADLAAREKPAAVAPTPTEIGHQYAKEASEALIGWFDQHKIVRRRFAADTGIPYTAISQICVGNHVRTDLELYCVLHIATGLPIFHPDRVPQRAIWTHGEWTTVEREWSHKEYWLKQLAAFAQLGADDPVPPELYAIPQEDDQPAEAEVIALTDQSDATVELPHPLVEEDVDRDDGVVDLIVGTVPEAPAPETIEPPPTSQPSAAALQFELLVGLITQSMIGQLSSQLQQALLPAGQQLDVSMLVESVRTVITDALAPLVTALESATNLQEQLSQQLRTLIDATQVQQDPGRDLSLAMRRFTRLLEDEMRKGPEERRNAAMQIGRALAQRLWMIDIIAGELDQIEERYQQHQIVGR